MNSGSFGNIPFSNWQSLPTPNDPYNSYTPYKPPAPPLKLHGSTLSCAVQYKAGLESPRELAAVLSLSKMKREAEKNKAKERREQRRQEAERYERLRQVEVERQERMRQVEAEREEAIRLQNLERQWSMDEGVGGEE